MKSFSTRIYVLKQTTYYTETTRLHYIVILDIFLRNKHIHTAEVNTWLDVDISQSA